MELLCNLPDEALAEQVSAGCVDAEEVLARRFGRLVKVIARPLYLVGGDNEDLIQEGMLGLLSAIRTFSPNLGVSFKAYAEICIRRRMLTAVKSATRQKHALLNDAIPLEFAQPGEHPTTFRGLEERILEKERTDELWRYFSTVLSALERGVLQLFLEGLSYAEIAARIEKPEKSVDNAIQRIRKKLGEIRET